MFPLNSNAVKLCSLYKAADGWLFCGSSSSSSGVPGVRQAAGERWRGAGFHQHHLPVAAAASGSEPDRQRRPSALSLTLPDDDPGRSGGSCTLAAEACTCVWPSSDGGRLSACWSHASSSSCRCFLSSRGVGLWESLWCFCSVTGRRRRRRLASSSLQTFLWKSDPSLMEPKRCCTLNRPEEDRRRTRCSPSACCISTHVARRLLASQEENCSSRRRFRF